MATQIMWGLDVGLLGGMAAVGIPSEAVVILSGAKDLASVQGQILRFAQNDAFEGRAIAGPL